MSSYDTPYQYIELNAEFANQPSNRATQVNRLKEVFEAAGWTTTIIPSLIEIVTGATAPSFGVCGLGPSNQNFFGVGKSTGSFVYTPVTDVDSCFEKIDEDEYGYKIPVGIINNQIVYSGGGGSLDVLAATGYSLIGLPGGTLSDASSRHANLKNIVFKLLSPIFYETLANDDGSYTTYIGTPENEEIIDAQTYFVNFGGQLNTSSTNLGGNGFVATSPSNVVDGNYAEVYVFYENEAPASALSANQVRFAQKLNGRFLDNPLIHPLLLHREDVGSAGANNNYYGLEAHQDIIGFIGPYWYDLVGNPTSATLSTAVWGGALRIKPLEGETGVPNIKKLIISGGTSVVTSNANKSFRDTMKISGGGNRYTFMVEATDISQTGYIGNVIFSLSGLSNTSGANLNGIVWPGGVANIFEPWVGWNWFDPSESAAELIPLTGMLPNAINIWRSNDLGNPPTNDRPFMWDNQLWQFWQTDLYPGTPASALAYQIGNLDNLGDMTIDGLALYELLTMSMTVGTIANGATEVLTIEASDAQDLSAGGVVLLRTNNMRLSFSDYVIEFPAGQKTVDVNITDNGLGTQENCRLTAIGSNGKLNLSVVADA